MREVDQRDCLRLGEEERENKTGQEENSLGDSGSRVRLGSYPSEEELQVDAVKEKIKRAGVGLIFLIITLLIIIVASKIYLIVSNDKPNTIQTPNQISLKQQINQQKPPKKSPKKQTPDENEKADLQQIQKIQKIIQQTQHLDTNQQTQALEQFMNKAEDTKTDNHGGHKKYKLRSGGDVDWDYFVNYPQQKQITGKWVIKAQINPNQQSFAQQLLTFYDMNIKKNDSRFMELQRKYYQNKYKVSTYSEKPFCIVIPSFNNIEDDRYLRNMKSVLMQDYKNYHIVFIDDGSSDGTGKRMKEFLKNQQDIITEDRYVVIINEKQMRPIQNLPMAARDHCKPMDIYVILDGDDWLIGKQVLKVFNSVYQEKNVWVAYSNFLKNGQQIGYSRPYPKVIQRRNAYRKFRFVASHLRTFYTQLLRNIKQEDFLDQNGTFFRASNDVAMLMPILEQSHKRVAYIPELTYYYNANTIYNNHWLRQAEQRHNMMTIKSRRRYKKLRELVFDKSQKQLQEEKEEKVDKEKEKLKGKDEASQNVKAK